MHISVYLCMYVCVHACLYMCIYIYTYVYVYVLQLAGLMDRVVEGFFSWPPSSPERVLSVYFSPKKSSKIDIRGALRFG